MSQFTVYVSQLNDAAAYYESLFGFNAAKQAEDHDESLILDSTQAQNKDLQLRLVADQQAAYVQTHEDSEGFIAWQSKQFWEDYHAFSAFGVLFESLPFEQGEHEYVHFIDAYGIRWKLVS